VLNRVGAYDLRTSMALVAASHLHVAADTGTGHMAAAFLPIFPFSSKQARRLLLMRRSLLPRHPKFNGSVWPAAVSI
jgi:hypothetical protein